MKHLHIAYASHGDCAGIVVKTQPGGIAIHTGITPITGGPYADWQALLVAIDYAVQAEATALTLYGHGPALQQLQLTRRIVPDDVAAYHFQAWRMLLQAFGKDWWATPIPPAMNPAVAVAEKKAA